MFIRAKRRGDKTYLQIVENHRDGKRVVQSVRATLGRLDVLVANGQLDSLLRSGLRFSRKLLVLDAHAKGECTKTHTTRIGPVLLCEKLWRDCHIGSTLQSFLDGRNYQFPLERVIFTVVLSRLFCPGSDRATLRWIRDYAIKDMEQVGLHHFYRAMGWLGEPVKESSNTSREFGKNSVEAYRKDRIEEALFCLRRDLFTSMELVFFDTTSLYFEGQGGESIGQRGKSKDHRPDLRQMVVGIVLDDSGYPVCSELLPGNTADVASLIPVAERLRERFGVENVCIVADRGMISAATIEELEARGWQYILGARMRNTSEVRDEVLSRGGRFREVYPLRSSKHDPAPLKVKEVTANGHRYVVCHNEEEAQDARHIRTGIVESLRKQLARNEKKLVGNKGFRRYLKSTGNHFEIDDVKVVDEQRYDGKYVLRTNTTLNAEEVALKYKQLWTVEAIFRTMKSTLDTRPIFHKCDDTIRGHVFCSFLALLLRKHLQDKLDAKGYQFEWAHVVQDVAAIEQVAVEHSGNSFLIRTEARGTAGKVMQAAGIALPPVLQKA